MIGKTLRVLAIAGSLAGCPDGHTDREAGVLAGDKIVAAGAESTELAERVASSPEGQPGSADTGIHQVIKCARGDIELLHIKQVHGIGYLGNAKLDTEYKLGQIGSVSTAQIRKIQQEIYLFLKDMLSQGEISHLAFEDCDDECVKNPYEKYLDATYYQLYPKIPASPEELVIMRQLYEPSPETDTVRLRKKLRMLRSKKQEELRETKIEATKRDPYMAGGATKLASEGSIETIATEIPDLIQAVYTAMSKRMAALDALVAMVPPEYQNRIMKEGEEELAKQLGVYNAYLDLMEKTKIYEDLKKQRDAMVIERIAHSRVRDRLIPLVFGGGHDFSTSIESYNVKVRQNGSNLPTFCLSEWTPKSYK